MKNKGTKSKVAEAAIGAVIGGAIAGPIGAVAGGLVAGHVESGLDRIAKMKPPPEPKDPAADDPIIHAHPKLILVPLDFSQPSRRALRFAREWAVVFGAEVCLLHVLEPTTAVGEFGIVPIDPVPPDRAKAALQDLARQEFPETVRVTVKVRKGAAYDQIATVARETKADLILIATHGHTGLKHVLLGSTAERVVRHAPCPVLTLRRAPAGKT